MALLYRDSPPFILTHPKRFPLDFGSQSPRTAPRSEHCAYYPSQLHDTLRTELLPSRRWLVSCLRSPLLPTILTPVLGQIRLSDDDKLKTRFSGWMSSSMNLFQKHLDIFLNRDSGQQDVMISP